MTAPNRFRALAAFGAVVIAILALHRLGTGPLALPRQWSNPALSDWARDRDPVTIALVVFRLMVLAAAYHLAITTAIAIAGRIMHLPSWVAAADSWTLPPLRSTWGRLAGLGLTATAALTPQLSAATAATRPTATIQFVDTPDDIGPSRQAILRTSDPGPSTGTATLRLLDEPVDANDLGDNAPEEPRTPPAESATEPAGARVDATVHLVQPGDHLWSIAEMQLTDHLGRPAADAEIVPYWQGLIAANPQVVDPDLIYPGQSLDVPPVPTR